MWAAGAGSSRREPAGTGATRSISGGRVGNGDVRQQDGCNPKIVYMNRVPTAPVRVARLVPGLPMTDAPFRSTRALKRELSAGSGEALISTLIGLRPYIWPSDRRDLKLRVVATILLLLL